MGKTCVVSIQTSVQTEAAVNKLWARTEILCRNQEGSSISQCLLCHTGHGYCYTTDPSRTMLKQIPKHISFNVATHNEDIIH